MFIVQGKPREPEGIEKPPRIAEKKLWRRQAIS